MDNELILEVAVGAIAAFAVIMVVMAAYREGKRVGAVAKSEAFETVSTGLSLMGTEWMVIDEDADEGLAAKSKWARVRFRQLGSRVIGDGGATAGETWSVEGSAQGRRLYFLSLDDRGRQQTLGSVMVEVDAAQREMRGIRTAWSEADGAASVHPIRLVRVDT